MAEMGQSGAHMNLIRDRMSPFGAPIYRIVVKKVNIGLNWLNFEPNQVNRLKLVKLEL